jgi:hypothetical protein
VSTKDNLWLLDRANAMAANIHARIVADAYRVARQEYSEFLAKPSYHEQRRADVIRRQRMAAESSAGLRKRLGRDS